SYVLEDQNFDPRPESVAGRITDSGFNIAYRAGVSNMKAYTPVEGARGSIAYVTGSHAFKTGFNLVMGSYEQTSRTLTNTQYTAVSGRPTSVIYYGTPVLAINRVRPNLGLYGQDQWTLKRMTLNAGLRFDWTDPNGDRIVQGDPFNPLANDELGRSLNLNFGKPVLAVCYDR
ncbi:MAG: hypothetical protein DMF90_29655, partial [Acidobacteria bacterium]